MGKMNDLTGKRFGRLVAIEPVGKAKDRHIVWRCVCDCGKETTVKSNTLLRGETKSCGCLHDENIGNIRRTHGGSYERLFQVWEGMRARCYRATCKDYKYYGGKGVKICDEWNDYAKFREWALANGYDPNAKFGDYTIDRINPYKDYSPDNCRWIPNAEQRQTRRDKYREINDV